MNPTWNWQTRAGLSYLTCSLLEPWNHGFFTRNMAQRSPEELSPILDPQAQVYRVKQVHGNRVLNTHEIANLGSSPRPEADGLLSTHPQESVWVCSADCVPILIGDIGTGKVAALHAGWRGTAAQILPQAIANLHTQGTQLQDLRIALGPAIAGSVYQVGLDVAQQVGKTVAPTASTASTASTQGDLIESLSQGEPPVLLPDPEPNHIRLDVRQVNFRQLRQLGINSQQMAIAPYCTYQHPDLFFSYRRDRLKSVQWSGIVSASLS